MKTIKVQSVDATPANVSDYGIFIGEDISEERLPIPFYPHVDEGKNIPFEYTGNAVLRTARIHPTDVPNLWLERHMGMTQFFIGLGSSAYAMLLGTPTQHLEGTAQNLPNVETLKCFKFPPGTGILLSRGTWHDFPMAINKPVTCITGNSEEVVDALVKMVGPGEMDQGDVYKIDLQKRLGIKIEVVL